MPCVGGHALQSVGQQFLQSEQVRPDRLLSPLDPGLFTLPDQVIQIFRRNKTRRAVERCRIGSGPDSRIKPARRLEMPPGFGQHALQPKRIEVHVRHRREQRVEREPLQRFGPRSRFRGTVGKYAHAFQRVQQQVLQRRRLGVFPAHADCRAAGALGRLLALITKHGTHNGWILGCGLGWMKGHF